MSRSFGRITSGADFIRMDGILQQIQNGRVGQSLAFNPTLQTTVISTPVYETDMGVILTPINEAASDAPWFITPIKQGQFSITFKSSVDMTTAPTFLVTIIGQK